MEATEILPVGTPLGIIVALHGRGVTGADLSPLAQAVGLDGVRWIFPDAPFEPPELMGGRQWFPPAPNPESGILESRKRILKRLGALEGEGISSRRIALLGFSQGAVMSLDAGVRYPRRLAGIVGLSGFLAFPERLGREKSPAASGLPILLTHGKNDDVLPVEGAREAQAVLRTEGFTVRLHEYLMGHHVIPETLEEVRRFLIKILGPDTAIGK